MDRLFQQVMILMLRLIYGIFFLSMSLLTNFMHVWIYNISFDNYDAGVPRQPKWNHLKDLHRAIKLCEEAWLATVPKNTSLD